MCAFINKGNPFNIPRLREGEGSHNRTAIEIYNIIFSSLQDAAYVYRKVYGHDHRDVFSHLKDRVFFQGDC